MARFEWLRRAAVQDGYYATRLAEFAVNQVGRFDRGSSGRIVYEIGVAVMVIREQRVWTRLDQDEKAACESAFVVYLRCIEDAKRAVMCWLWFARSETVAKDIRLLIADLIWEERAAWSERPVFDCVLH